MDETFDYQLEWAMLPFSLSYKCKQRICVSESKAPEIDKMPL